MQWIADQVPAKRLAPPAGTMERYRLMEWLNYITAELHKGFGALFNPAMPEEAKALTRTKLIERFKYVDEKLAGRDYLMGDDFTVADGYLFVITRWAVPMKVDLSPMTNLGKFMERMAGRPAVQKALEAEGLTGTKP